MPSLGSGITCIIPLLGARGTHNQGNPASLEPVPNDVPKTPSATHISATCNPKGSSKTELWSRTMSEPWRPLEGANFPAVTSVESRASHVTP